MDGDRPPRPAEWLHRQRRRYRRNQCGPWPAIIDNPQVEYLEHIERDGFIQHRVRVEIAPERTAFGYLLVPIGAERGGAVFVRFYGPETSIKPGKSMHDFAYQLARRGFVTLAIAKMSLRF